MDNHKGYFTHRDYHESFLLCYTYAGEGSLLYKGRTFAVPCDTGFLIDCRSPHEYRCTGNRWKHADIHFWGTDGAALYQHFQNYGIITFTLMQAVFNSLLTKVLDAYSFYSDLRVFYIKDALYSMLCFVLKKSEKEGVSRIPALYKYMIRYIKSNYLQPLSLNNLSELFHISKYHMVREFKKYTGYSPSDYMISLRVQHACILLAQSSLTIERICEQSGFDNMSNFITQFKKRTGMTPSAFRSNAGC